MCSRSARPATLPSPAGRMDRCWLLSPGNPGSANKVSRGRPGHLRESYSSADVADGSSFYVMEPMAGGVSQLVIRNLDLGLEIHHDLGNLQTASDGYAGLARYSVDGSEVVFQPGALFFGGDRAVGFFPTDGSEPRQLRTSVQESVVAKFVSSNEGYFALRRGDGLATVKREYRHDGTEVSVHEPWSRDLLISQVSDDGLAGRAWQHGGPCTRRLNRRHRV